MQFWCTVLLLDGFWFLLTAVFFCFAGVFSVCCCGFGVYGLSVPLVIAIADREF
jgi:hypothetical protein